MTPQNKMIALTNYHFDTLVHAVVVYVNGDITLEELDTLAHRFNMSANEVLSYFEV